MTSREMFALGSKWTDTTTRLAFPILLRHAIDGSPITYGGLNQALHALGQPSVIDIAYRYVAGKVGKICKELRAEMRGDVPPLNAIIVNQATHLPSSGVDSFLQTYFGSTAAQIKKLSQDQRNAYARTAMERVFNYEGWDRVRQHLGITQGSLGALRSNRGSPIPLPDPRSFATGPETAAHKSLKRWVAAHPGSVKKFGEFQLGVTEQWLSSGDRLDVFFENAQTQLGVEVKTRDAPPAEVQRGIYQCVKYRATLRAMQLAQSRPPNAQAVLVLDQTPTQNINALAMRLSVTIIDVGHLRR